MSMQYDKIKRRCEYLLKIVLDIDKNNKNSLHPSTKKFLGSIIQKVEDSLAQLSFCAEGELGFRNYNNSSFLILRAAKERLDG